MTTCGNTVSTSSVASAEPLLPTLSVPLTLDGVQRVRQLQDVGNRYLN